MRIRFLIRLLFAPSNFKRFLFFFSFDVAIIVFSLYASFLLRFDFVMPLEYKALILKVLPFFLITKLLMFALFRFYRITWRYVGINDLFNIVNALIASESILMAFILIPVPDLSNYLPNAILKVFYPNLHGKGFPRSIFLIDVAVSLILLSAVRVSKRVYLEIFRKRRMSDKGKRTIIIGAGNTGEMMLRDIVKQGFQTFYPVGFLDDDSHKIGAYLHSVKVLGSTDNLKDYVVKFGIEAIIIAIPSLDYKSLRRIYDSATELNISMIKIVPRIYDFHRPEINLKRLEDISIEDLIGRDTVRVNFQEIENFLKGKVILITGAGGSIGSEITIQLCAFQPERLVLLDIDETELHNIRLRLKREFPTLFLSTSDEPGDSCMYAQTNRKLCFITGDIRDQQKIDEIFRSFRPQIVFHAAAYKHVPMMEYNAEEAVKVNMMGTLTLARTAVKYNADNFIMISTDKAVRPTSIMGATKRMAEYICRAFNGKTRFISVRFGNVLGSRGSVLPLFLEQLKYGGPLTVTHEDMQRYFMTIPEAVSLVLQASVIGSGGEVLVLDMGQPVRIVELAEELIRIHGLTPYKDIDIEFIGLRPGEKLFEEILTAEEGTVASKHEKVFVARNSEKYTRDEIGSILMEFEAVLKDRSDNWHPEIKRLLTKYVRHFDTNQA